MPEIAAHIRTVQGRLAPLQLAVFGLLMVLPAAQGQVQTPANVPGAWRGPVPATGAPGVKTTAQVPIQPAGSITAPRQAPSQSQEPPQQANIQLAPDALTIHARNASLTQTLQRIADKTGMHLEGVGGDERVFGEFGPGAPRDVLNTLLTGTGYNIVMVGELQNGAPRELILSEKSTLIPGRNPGQRQVAEPVQNNSEDDASDPAQDEQAPPMIGAPQRDGNGPGAARAQQEMLQRMRQQGDQQGPPPQQ